jgi:hypothetical protein
LKAAHTPGQGSRLHSAALIGCEIDRIGRLSDTWLSDFQNFCLDHDLNGFEL